MSKSGRRNVSRKRPADHLGEETMSSGLQCSFVNGSLGDEKADMVAVVSTAALDGLMVDKMRGFVGAAHFDNALKASRESLGHRRLNEGEVVLMDLHTVPTSPYKYICLVVMPQLFHIRMAYRQILEKAVAKKCESVAIPGIGCGGCGMPAQSSATKLAEVIRDFTNLGTVKTLRIVDMDKSTVRTFKDVLTGPPPQPAPAGGVVDEVVQSARKYTRRPEQVSTDQCSVCMDDLNNGMETVEFTLCVHQIHFDCFVSLLRGSQRRSCTVCNMFFAIPEGNMPPGTMHVSRDSSKCGGYENDSTGTIIITYHFPSGIQGPNHIRPGQHYHGTSRTAYLPENAEGTKVLGLLRKAFDCKLTFTVGDSVTTGAQNCVVWNNIHHKTSPTGGSTNFGFPDKTYLNRVTQELAAVGIIEP